MNDAFFKNKIEAEDVSIDKLLSKEKYFIDFFQRDYRWGREHIEKLIEDLTGAFQESYDPEDDIEKVEYYRTYYLGPLVFCREEGRWSIIDGQQRITSLTLLLVYLNNLLKTMEEVDTPPLSDLIFSGRGRKHFNLEGGEDRTRCMESLFKTGDYTLADSDSETVANLVDRYHDIEAAFPDEIIEDGLVHFIDWLTNNVILVRIKTYSNDNAYEVFESMNDRGLRLTTTEMLKAYVMSRISSQDKCERLDTVWKDCMKDLHEIEKNRDISFFQALFRSKYARAIRQGKAGSKNEDFEIIGTKFHEWFKDNHEALLGLKTGDDIYRFFTIDVPFFVKWYCRINGVKKRYDEGMPYLNNAYTYGIATSLQEPLLLAAIKAEDDTAAIERKINWAAKAIEVFTVNRSVNRKRFGHDSIKYTIFQLILKIRDSNLEALKGHLREFLDERILPWESIGSLRLVNNKNFIRYYLSRVTSYVDYLSGDNSTYADYYYKPKQGKAFEIEHIWADNPDYHKDECESDADFKYQRNRIGALALLQRGKNQSYGGDDYPDKLEHYIKGNNYLQTLHPLFYEKNPTFRDNPLAIDAGFKAHEQFKIADIDDRCDTLVKLSKQIWNTDFE